MTTATCFVTHQPIRLGNTVVLLPLRRRTGGAPAAARFSLHDAFWAPYGMAIHATYHDGQDFQLHRAFSDRLALEHLFRRLNQPRSGQLSATSNPVLERISRQFSDEFRAFVERRTPNLLRRIEEQPVVDWPVLEAELRAAWNQVWPNVQQMPVCTYNPSSVEWEPLAFAAMHQAAFDELVALRARTPDRQGLRMKLDRFVKRNLDEARAKAVEYLSRDGKPKQAALVPHIRENFWDAMEDQLQVELSLATSAKDQIIQRYLDGQLFDVIEEIESWLLSVYALSALDLLDIPLTPVVFRRTDSVAGGAYAALAGRVSRQLTVRRKAAQIA